METSSTYSETVITQMGRLAHHCLASGQHGKVLAVFSKAIYLLTDTDELFWIATDDSRMHQRCAQIASPLPRPLVGSPFRVTDRHLIIDPGFLFRVEEISLWNVPRFDQQQVLNISLLPAQIYSTFSNLKFSQAKGFGNFISYILSLVRAESNNFSSEAIDPILRTARPLILDTARACLEHEPSRISHNAAKLIGLGTGLTPSGDDFLGGLVFAIHNLRAAYPNFDFTDYAIPLESFHSKTHLISFTLLKDHAHGQASAPLHHIVNGLLVGEPSQNIFSFISQLTQIGHSTGWDLLAGLLTGFLITFQNSLPQVTQ